MNDISKKQIKHLRKIAHVAYERELSFHFDNLRKKFDEWKDRKMDVWELSDIIHEFHDGKSRDLYKFYVYGKHVPYQVAYAVKNEYISMDEIEESCREHIQQLVDRMILVDEEDNFENNEESIDSEK